MEEDKNALKILKVKPTGKRPLERPWRRWENNIRMDLKKIGTNTGIRLIRHRIGLLESLCDCDSISHEVS